MPMPLHCCSVYFASPQKSTKSEHNQHGHQQIRFCQNSRAVCACGTNHGCGRGRGSCCGSRTSRCCGGIYGLVSGLGRGCWGGAPYFGVPSFQAPLVDCCQWKCALWHWHTATRNSLLIINFVRTLWYIWSRNTVCLLTSI